MEIIVELLRAMPTKKTICLKFTFVSLMKFILLILMIICCACGGSNNNNKSINTIAVVNNAAATSYWNPSVLSAFVERSNAQLSQDIAPHWGLRVHVQLDSGDAVLTFEPGTNSNGVAWHNDTPAAFVFVGDPTIIHGGTGQALLDAQHEIIEMAEDPDLTGKEIVDPVACLTYNQGEPVKGLECGENGEGLDRCVPDFVFPNYFIVGSTGPWDWMSQVKAPKVSPCS